MIRLGCFDAGVTQNTLDAYVKLVQQTTRVSVNEIKEGSDKLFFREFIPDKRQPMTITEVQQSLRDLGFFPGGLVNGICGYRTLSAIRLFQEYVRTRDKLPSVPDGIFGPNTLGHLRRWIDRPEATEWASKIKQWQDGTSGESEYTQWLTLLTKVKSQYTAKPNRMLQKVNEYVGNTDTKKVADWEFDPKHMHLIGIRRNEFSGKFDDIIIFLIKGLVFKFQGSTEPGSSSNPNGTPFLVQGQHDYHFGWHRKQYLALRPRYLNKGVLVVRSKGDKRLDDHDLDNGLESNASINIHWGGKGITFNVNKWSEGCQVINGTMYLNHNNELIDCSTFAARNNADVAGPRTRGAYNVLLDLATALSSDMGSRTIKYMLLNEQDLDLDPALKQGLADTRTQAGRLLR